MVVVILEHFGKIDLAVIGKLLVAIDHRQKLLPVALAEEIHGDARIGELLLELEFVINQVMTQERGQFFLAPDLVSGLVEAIELLGILEHPLGLLVDQRPLDQVAEHALRGHIQLLLAEAMTGIAVNELCPDRENQVMQRDDLIIHPPRGPAGFLPVAVGGHLGQAIGIERGKTEGGIRPRRRCGRRGPYRGWIGGRGRARRRCAGLAIVCRRRIRSAGAGAGAGCVSDPLAG